MSANGERHDFDPGAKKLRGAMLEHSGLAVERMPGLAYALDHFVVEAPRRLAPLFGRTSDGGTIETVQDTTLSREIGDCAGLAAAVYASAEPEARLLIALDERIDDLIVASIFGENIAPEVEDDPEAEEPRARTAIEAALVEEFARALGRALEAAFAPIAPLSLALDRLTTLTDAYALGRRDMPAAAARFSLPMNGGACECLLLLPQSLLLPLRKDLEREQTAEAPSADRRWSLSMETGIKQTRLPVAAVLEELPMSLGDVANLRIGAILPLRRGDFNSIRLECAGRGMFLCKLGQGDGRYRLEIDGPIAQGVDPVTR
jgi:flagellar motor switch protein FliM